MKKREHPCFEKTYEAVRIHLPIAPLCNVGCRYCNRKMDCVNESRPGVSSKVLQPYEACKLVADVSNKGRLDVVGIAGPGDPMANYKELLETVRLIRNFYQKKCIDFPLFCLSTNGLSLERYAEELYENGVSYYTFTINSLNEKVSTGIYDFVTYDGKKYIGMEASKLLKKKQLEALDYLSQKRVHIKINMVYIEGINDTQVLEIAHMAKYYNCDLLNIMPMIHVPDTPLYNAPMTDESHLYELKKRAKNFVPLMEHCMHCRADAFGTIPCVCENKR